MASGRLRCTLRRGLARLRALSTECRESILPGCSRLRRCGTGLQTPHRTHGQHRSRRPGGWAGRQACQARLERVRVCACVRASVGGWMDGWIMAEVVHSYRLHQCEGSGMAGRARKLGAVQAVQAG